MSLPNLDGKYTSGKRRKKLFSDSPRRKVAIPASIVIIGILLLLFWLVPVYTIEPVLPIQPEDLPTTTPVPTLTPTPTATSVFASFGGRIVFTCTRGEINQICAVNADGTNYKQITESERNNYYPTFTPDMKGVVFATNEGDYFDLFLLNFDDSKLTRLTTYIGNAFSPKFSPDGSQILFLNLTKDTHASLWSMGGRGENPRLLYLGPRKIVGADWSPDGKTIAFAMAAEQVNAYEIFLLNASDPTAPPRRVTQAIEGVTGSLDWALDGKSLLLCMGPAGDKDVFRLDLATGNAIQLTFGGNNASASYSPDGQYIVYNSLRNDGQADLFIVRADGHSTRLLLDNPEPDWQPVWGP
ncbi:MAG: PD40 domain-containing protein [Chloroflexi bacterium]|nr:PD40 domain-containing protein [Chloroflexota bacterium]